MNTESRKRLEEAAEKISNCRFCGKKRFGFIDCKVGCISYNIAMQGVGFGYKEAIQFVKEWLEINTEEYATTIDGKEYIERNQILADFEADMTKLWEDE